MMTERLAREVILFRDCENVTFMGTGTSGVNIVVYIIQKAFSCDFNLGFTLNDGRKTCRRGNIIKRL